MLIKTFSPRVQRLHELFTKMNSLEQEHQALAEEFDKLLNVKQIGRPKGSKSVKTKRASPAKPAKKTRKAMPLRDDTKIKAKILTYLAKNSETRNKLAEKFGSTSGRVLRVLEALKAEGKVAMKKEQKKMSNGRPKTFDIWGAA